MGKQLTPQEKYEFGFKMAEIYLFADMLERKILEVNPIRYFNDYKSVIKFETAQQRVSDLRKHMDKINTDYEQWGECADQFEELVHSFLKGKEKEQLAEGNQNGS